MASAEFACWCLGSDHVQFKGTNTWKRTSIIAHQTGGITAVAALDTFSSAGT